jgi:hypothetical protein
MTTKEKKTAPELAAMIMDEIRRYPQFNDIAEVTISRAQQGLANWSATSTVAASQSGPWPVFPEFDKLVRLFQADFELADSPVLGASAT